MVACAQCGGLFSNVSQEIKTKRQIEEALLFGSVMFGKRAVTVTAMAVTRSQSSRITSQYSSKVSKL